MSEAKNVNEENPYLKWAQIPRPQDVKDRKTLSLHLLVKNGETCVGRLLDNVGPYIDEVVAVLNDCEDGTEEILAERCKHFGIPFVPFFVTRENHPELYILDEEATYQGGRSLSGEEFGGPFTGQPILAEWSVARNFGWHACTKEWKLFLDADDVVVDPENIPGIISLLERYGVELAATQYHFYVDAEGRPMGSSFRERLAKNINRIQWARPIHEVLTGTNRITHLRDHMVVRDMRDNHGKGVRIPGRNFKILYERCRRKDWVISPRFYADLLMEVRHMAHVPGMMDFASALLDHYLEDATWPEERAWVYAMVSEMREMQGQVDAAIEGYRESLEIHPGTKTAWRLCRALFKKAVAMKEELAEHDAKFESMSGQEGGVSDEVLSKMATEGLKKEEELKAMWRAVIEAQELGVANKAAHQVLDDGPLYEDMEEIHAAGAFIELGDLNTAFARLEKAVVAFPEASALRFMHTTVKKALAGGDHG